MAFPLSIAGSIVIDTHIYPELIPSVIVGRLQDLLSEAKASEVFVDGDTVGFTNRFIRMVSSWNILVPFDSGRFAVVPGADGLEVRYLLSTRRLLRAITMMLGGFGAIMVAVTIVTDIADASGASEVAQDGLGAAALPAILWLWVFGLNYLIARTRMPSWLKNGLIY